jgi:hypothetical protein
MEPAWSRFAGHGYRVVFPAGFEMIGHLAFAKRPVAKAALSGGEFVVHSSRTYRRGQSGSSPFSKKSKVQGLRFKVRECPRRRGVWPNAERRANETGIRRVLHRGGPACYARAMTTAHQGFATLSGQVYP